MSSDGEAWFQTVRGRVRAALAILVLLLVCAIGLALREVADLQRRSRTAARLDEASHLLERFGAGMRDAYAHQAHTVILGDLSHVDHYGDAIAAAGAARRAIADDVAGLDATAAAAHREDAALLARALTGLDTSFRRDVLPLITNGAPAAAVADAHHQAVMLVDSAQLTLNRMAARLEVRSATERAEVELARDRLLKRSGVIVVVAALLGIGVALWLDRRVSRPLAALEEIAAQIGRGAGGAIVEVDAGSAAELRALAGRMRAMALELRAREEKLVAAERLASVGRLAAGVAHEVNNPLAVMLGYVRLIEQRAADESIRADARLTLLEIARVQAIVRGLLELARPPRLAVDAVDVVALVVDAAAPFGSDAAGPRVRVASVGPCIAEIDAGKVTQIVRNLLQNAVDAAADSVVDVDVDVTVAGADVVDVVVRDRGAGFDAAARARLFEPFFTQKPTGTGLGLAVSQRLAAAHGGALDVLDNAPDGGARVRLRLPLRAAPEPA